MAPKWKKKPYLRLADLRKVKLTGDLSGLDFTGSDLSLADLRQTNLSKATFRFCAMVCCNLAGANLEFADLTKANLIGSCLSFTFLRGVKASFADIQFATGPAD